MFHRSVVDRAVIHYLHFQRSLRKVSKIYGTSAASLSRWVRKEATPQRATSKRSPQVALREEVKRLVDENPFTTLGEIVGALRASGIASSKSTVHRCLKHQRYTRKRAAHRYAPRNPSSEDARRFLRSVEGAKEVISVDESSVLLESLPLYGYSLKGTRPVKRTKRPPKGNRVTLLLAVSNTRGVVAWKTYKGSCNAASFSDFVGALQAPPKSVLTLDNVRFHHSKPVKDVANKLGFVLCYTPPYSPDFNFVENAFSVIKQRTRRFDGSLPAAVALITPEKASAFFRHMLKHVREVATELKDEGASQEQC